jgi:hypothetical protein
MQDLLIPLLVLSLALVIGIPALAWNRWPRGFRRLNWLGVMVGAWLVGLILMALAVEQMHQDRFTGRLLLCGGAVLLATGIGSLVAVFFWRPVGSCR